MKPSICSPWYCKQLFLFWAMLKLPWTHHHINCSTHVCDHVNIETQHKLNIKFGFTQVSLTSVEVDLHLLSHYEIEAWLIYYMIQHCLPIIMIWLMGNGWEDLSSFDRLVFFFFFLFFFKVPCDGHFFHCGFSFNGQDSFHIYMPFFLLVMSGKRSLGHNYKRGMFWACQFKKFFCLNHDGSVCGCPWCIMRTWKAFMTTKGSHGSNHLLPPTLSPYSYPFSLADV